MTSRSYYEKRAGVIERMRTVFTKLIFAIRFLFCGLAAATCGADTGVCGARDAAADRLMGHTTSARQCEQVKEVRDLDSC